MILNEQSLKCVIFFPNFQVYVMNGSCYKRAVVVLGAGRCGTSLLMQILNRLGMRVSGRLVPPKAHNAGGPMEDVEIAQIYDEVILKQVGSTRTLPFPDNILPEDVYKFGGKALADIVTRNVSSSQQLWGFKDPFTSCLLPLWYKVFNVSGVVPVFILSVRNPASSVLSREKHFGVNSSLGELAWLVNYVDALRYTSLDLFIVHYEDWFSRPLEQVSALADYVGIDSCAESKMSAVDIVKSSHNHSNYHEYVIQNEHVKNLYNVLQISKGATHDRKTIMNVVKDCRAAMSGFKGWYFEAHKYISLNKKNDTELANNLQNEIARISSKHERTVSALEANCALLLERHSQKVNTLEADLASLVEQNNHLVQEVMSHKSDKIALRMQIINEQSKNDDVSFKHLLSLAFKHSHPKTLIVRKIFKFSSLKSFFNKKFMNIKSDQKIKKLKNKFILRDPDSNLIRVKFRDALRHPGKNTVLFPLKFIKYLLEIVIHKFRKK
ncbi:MAG: sulfotransferase [Bacteroidales bacterium]